MKFLTLLFVLIQMNPAALEMLRENPNRSAVNCHVYQFIDETRTPAPKGYKPVYISHYGRHGSRTDGYPYEYDYLTEVLRQADKEGILTTEGKELLEEVRGVVKVWDRSPGHLTKLGEKEHAELARRMYAAYGDVFRKGSRKVRVVASTIPRSILSMSAFTNTLQSRCKGLEFTYVSGDREYQFMDNKGSYYHSRATRRLTDSLKQCNLPDFEAVYPRLFTNPARGRELSVDPARFNTSIWTTACFMEPSGVGSNGFRHLGEDVIYYKWDNLLRLMYVRHGNSVEFGEDRMGRLYPLAEDMLLSADKALSGGEFCADLYFGHDCPLIALAGYFGLEDVGARLSFDEIPYKWADPRNITLATNMQMIFYRNSAGKVLVKFVYNGVERHLIGMDAVQTVYYDWNAVKSRFLKTGNPLGTIEWKSAGNGIEYTVVQAPVFGVMQCVSAVRFKASEHVVDVIDAPEELADSTSALALREGALAAINGSYFNVKKLTPVTFVKDAGVQKGTTTKDETFRTDGMITLASGNNMRILRCTPETALQYSADAEEALAAGPILLVDGREIVSDWPKSSFYTNRHPRSIVGSDDEGRIYFMVIDGRFAGRGWGASISETAQLARMVGMTDALNLDGGGSSTLWVNCAGVINHPYDNQRFDGFGQRIVPNILVVR
ncbi:MAG: phosphodiester glycosidase family protein [Bacteroidales bacterium]|nr:phosphodiester glycosidase family protein [Bacteroidales bacterium]